ncbi:MAG: hypothetical protein Q8876_08150 [Bacillota bacterium]|nr:hypothetical protein [Bacillota bacterium]
MKKHQAFICIFIFIIFFMSSCKNNQQYIFSSNSKVAESLTISSINSVNKNMQKLPFSDYSCELGKNIESFMETIKNNPIDIAYLNDENTLDKNKITAQNQADLLNKYSKIWENEMNNVLSKIRSKCTGQALASINSSQNSWLKHNGDEGILQYQTLLNSVGQGSGNGIITATAEVDRIRHRTFELAEYYTYLYKENYVFRYR